MPDNAHRPTSSGPANGPASTGAETAATSGQILRRCVGLVAAAVLIGLAGLLLPAAAATAQVDAEPVQYPADEPADGKWLEDEDGTYYIARVDRSGEGRLFRRRGDVLRFRLGLTFRLVGEDEESLHVRVRKRERDAQERVRTAEPRPPVDDEPVPRTPESQLATAGSSLIMSSFDAGLPKGGMWRNGVDLVDFNQDGRLDIVAPPARKGSPVVSVFFNLGEGRWTQRVVTGYEGGRLDYGDIRARDFDGDGRVDIALAMHLMGTTVAYQEEPGRWIEREEGFDRPNFAKPNSRFGKRAPWSSRAFEVLDLDKDGDIDIVAVGEGADSLTLLREKTDQAPVWSEGITVYRNNGDGPWTAYRFPDLPFGGNTIDVGQVDDDPEPELIVAWITANDHRLIVNIVPTPDGFSATPSELSSLGTSAGSITVAEAHDVRTNRAGDEILVGRIFHADDGMHSHVELHERVDGEWTSSLVAEMREEERVLSLAAGDLDADGIVDVVAGTGRGSVFAFHGKPDGTFVQQPVKLEEHRNTTCKAFWVRMADLDGQPGDEVVAGFAGETSQIPVVGQEAPGCAGQGSIEAWTFRRASDQTSEAALAAPGPP